MSGPSDLASQQSVDGAVVCPKCQGSSISDLGPEQILFKRYKCLSCCALFDYKWKSMDVVFRDTLYAPRCLILGVHTSADGWVLYEGVSENDGMPSIPEDCAMTKLEWLKWLDHLSDDLTGREMREARERAEAPLVEPESWAGFRARYAETGDPWKK